MTKRIIILFTLLGLTACAHQEKQVVQATKKKEARAETAYRIGVDDRLQVAVWRNPDLSVTVPVRPDGKISVPLIGDVNAMGLTPTEVAADVRNKLGYFIRDPNVSIIVTEMHSNEFLNRVRVTGAVRTPASLPYRPGMTVLDAVLQAGGINDFAAPERTKVHRRSQSNTEVIPIRLGSILNKGGLESNIEVKPGDVISVPERMF